MLSGAAAVDKIRTLLKEFPIAFMITVLNGDVRARPIGIVGDHAAFDGSLWFITDRRSAKVSAIASGAVTSLVFQDDDRGTYLHMTGHASVVEDVAKLRELYTPVQRTWFPDGLDDPNMTLLRFDLQEAHYWEGHQSIARLIVAFAKSAVTGQPGKSGDVGIARP
jgi:general stress protein 26